MDSKVLQKPSRNFDGFFLGFYGGEMPLAKNRLQKICVCDSQSMFIVLQQIPLRLH